MPSPNGSLRRRLLALASELLAGEGEPVERVEVIVRTPDGRCEHVIRSGPGELGPVALPGLSDLDRGILAAASQEPLPAKRLAAKMRRSCNPYFRDHLRGLVRRGLLLQTPDGYRLP